MDEVGLVRIIARMYRWSGNCRLKEATFLEPSYGGHNGLSNIFSVIWAVTGWWTKCLYWFWNLRVVKYVLQWKENTVEKQIHIVKNNMVYIRDQPEHRNFADKKYVQYETFLEDNNRWWKMWLLSNDCSYVECINTYGRKKNTMWLICCLGMYLASQQVAGHCFFFFFFLLFNIVKQVKK